MVSRTFGTVALALALGAGAAGCVHQDQGPEAWASLPVVVAGVDASSFTIRIDENITFGGKEVEEVADRGRWKTKVPEALRERLEAAGFKVVAAGEPADLILALQTTDVEWTGRFWEAKGDVAATLTPPNPDAAGAPPPGGGTSIPALPAATAAPVATAAPSADPGAAPKPASPAVAHTSTHFAGLDFPLIADALASSIADQLVRSTELSQWLKDKRAKEEAAKAPPPPPAPPPAPPKGLEAAQVKAVMVGMRAAYRGCYDAVLVNNPNLGGTVAIKLAIAPSGEVASVGSDASGTLTDTGLTGCVVDVTKTAHFPKAEGPTTVVYPVAFATSAEPDVNKGGLEAAEVQKGIRGQHDKMRNCFEAALKKDPAFNGIVKVKFAIDLKGKVPSAKAAKDSPIQDKDVEKCVVEVVKGATFSKPKRWTEVVYPVHFVAE